MKLEVKDFIDPQTEYHYACTKITRGATDLHTHEFYEIFLVTGGRVVHIVNGVEDTLADGSLVFVRPEDAHCYEKSEDSQCQLYNLAFPRQVVDALSRFLEDGFPSEGLLFSTLPPKTLLSQEEKSMVIQELEKLSILHQSNKRAVRCQMRIFLSFIFSTYFSKFHHKTGKSIPSWLIELCSEMKKKENFFIGLPRLHELGKRSPEHINRMFAKHLGKSPTLWINDTRLLYAANRLTNSDEEIINVALDSGFQNLSHFYHQFKLRFETSPYQYRKHHRQSIIP